MLYYGNVFFKAYLFKITFMSLNDITVIFLKRK